MAELGATVELGLPDESQLTEEEDNADKQPKETHCVKADPDTNQEEDDDHCDGNEGSGALKLEQSARGEEEKNDDAAPGETASVQSAADSKSAGGEEGLKAEGTEADAARTDKEGEDDDDDELLTGNHHHLDAPASELFGEEDDPPPTESRALFGDDEMMAEEVEEASREARPMKARRVAGRGADEKPGYVTLPVRLPPATPSEKDELWILGLPMTMSVDHEIFDHADASAHERRIIQERNGPAMKAMRAALTPGCIRAMKKSDGELISNTRLVEFSDGTCALFVGKSVCEAQARGEEGQLFLVEMSQDPIYHVHGTLSQRRVFKPPNVASADTRNVRVTSHSQKKTKLTTVQAGAESEMKVKRHLEEQALKDIESVERKPKKKRYSALDANFLEADE